MVKQWQDLFFDHRYSETPMLNPDFTGVAAAYGIAGERVATRRRTRLCHTTYARPPRSLPARCTNRPGLHGIPDDSAGAV